MLYFYGDTCGSVSVMEIRIRHRLKKKKKKQHSASFIISHMTVTLCSLHLYKYNKHCVVMQQMHPNVPTEIKN